MAKQSINGSQCLVCRIGIPFIEKLNHLSYSVHLAKISAPHDFLLASLMFKCVTETGACLNLTCSDICHITSNNNINSLKFLCTKHSLFVVCGNCLANAERRLRLEWVRFK